MLIQIANEAWAVSDGRRTHSNYAVKVLEAILVLDDKEGEIVDTCVGVGVAQAHSILVHVAHKLCGAVTQRRKGVNS